MMQKGILTEDEGRAGFRVLARRRRDPIRQMSEVATRLTERRILNLVEGSGGQMSFAEIGRRLGISREWVRILARRAGSDARRMVRLELTCPRCGRVFTAPLGQRRRFCSLECYHAPRVELVCEVCGKTYTRMENQLRGRRSRFCSRVCHGKWLSGLKQPQRP